MKRICRGRCARCDDAVHKIVGMRRFALKFEKYWWDRIICLAEMRSIGLNLNICFNKWISTFRAHLIWNRRNKIIYRFLMMNKEGRQSNLRWLSGDSFCKSTSRKSSMAFDTIQAMYFRLVHPKFCTEKSHSRWDSKFLMGKEYLGLRLTPQSCRFD